MKNTEKEPHSIHTLAMEERKILHIGGLSDTVRFEDNIAVFYTTSGCVTVKGKNLAVSDLSIEKGELTLTGEINSISYGDKDRIRRASALEKLTR